MYLYMFVPLFKIQPDYHSMQLKGEERGSLSCPTLDNKNHISVSFSQVFMPGEACWRK